MSIIRGTMEELLSRSEPALAGLVANVRAGVLSESDCRLVARLLGEGQDHLFADWEAPGEADGVKREFLDTLATADASYPGGLPGYIRNARTLLREAAAGTNPFEGCIPAPPATVDLSRFDDAYEAAEAVGWQAFADTAVVLVAGGLGERLGYNGIKLDIPVEVTGTTSYLAHYASVLRAAGSRLGREIPLVIMTSRDTHDGTLASLEQHDWFGLSRGQVTLLRQELVPAVSDLDGRLALEGPCRLIMKPHGHGDVHMLLHSTGTARSLSERGVRYLLFIQDTNGQVFNAAFAAVGVSEREGFDFNSLAVNRVPGEAVGGIARLDRTGAPALTVNVEYNQLDPLLRATVNPEGDVANAQGYSSFPGNINVLVIRMAPYLSVLERSQGIIAEFINPKFADASRSSFKKPARLETMMQDLPKLFTGGEKVGVTVFQREWCFSACKNNLADAAAKAAAGAPPESASTAENDFYRAGRMRLAAAGMEVVDGAGVSFRGIPFVSGPRVLLRPGFALTLDEGRRRIRGGRIEGDSTLLLDGDIVLEDVRVLAGGTLAVIAGPGVRLTVRGLVVSGGPSFEMVPLTDAEMGSPEVPEYLRIRGYRIVNRGAVLHRVTEPGDWEIGSDGSLRKVEA